MQTTDEAAFPNAKFHKDLPSGVRLNILKFRPCHLNFFANGAHELLTILESAEFWGFPTRPTERSSLAHF